MRVATPASMTDLYELTMAAGYWAAGRTERAVFELFTRRLPRDRGYLVACGLDDAAEYLEGLRFSSEEIAYLRSLPVFAATPAEFFAALAELRFTGDVWAVPEGTPVFPNEPILTVNAPIVEAQIVETALLALVNFPTSVATKASRVVEAASGRPVIEFGARRAHGTDAALVAARAAYVGGCVGTSNVEAGMRFGLPLYGTIAHAWVMSFDDEVEAFRAYQRAFPNNTVLLIDTYDTVRAAERIVDAFAPGEVAGVRIDSGDLGELARAVRSVLDAGGFQDTKVLVSGDLNEWSITDLVEGGAPIDGFGVGTDLVTVKDAPALGVVYKLVEIDVHGVRHRKMKRSEGKATLPGRKQAWRLRDSEGRALEDVVTLVEESAPSAGATPLLEPLLVGGRRTAPRRSLEAIRSDARDAVGRLPERLRGLGAPAEPYKIRVSDRIHSLVETLAAEAAS